MFFRELHFFFHFGGLKVSWQLHVCSCVYFWTFWGVGNSHEKLPMRRSLCQGNSGSIPRVTPKRAREMFETNHPCETSPSSTSHSRFWGFITFQIRHTTELLRLHHVYHLRKLSGLMLIILDAQPRPLALYGKRDLLENKTTSPHVVIVSDSISVRLKWGTKKRRNSSSDAKR